MFKVPENYRITKGAGRLNSTKSDGNNGAFLIKSLKLKGTLTAIASDGGNWEHVSVSLPNRCPSWNEMLFVKNIFWGENDCVIQFFPTKKRYVNCHPYTLHLWRSLNYPVTLPPLVMV